MVATFPTCRSDRENAALIALQKMFPISLDILSGLSKQIKAHTLQLFLSHSLFSCSLLKYIHTHIHKYSCRIFTFDFFIHMWIFFDPVSVIFSALGPTENPAWRNVSMGSNISYRTDTRQSTESVEVWFCAAMIPVIIFINIYIYDLVFPFHIPCFWAVLKRFARWMFKHSSDIIQLHSVNTQYWYLVSMAISMSDVLTFLQAPKECSC